MATKQRPIEIDSGLKDEVNKIESLEHRLANLSTSSEEGKAAGKANLNLLSRIRAKQQEKQQKPAKAADDNLAIFETNTTESSTSTPVLLPPPMVNEIFSVPPVEQPMQTTQNPAPSSDLLGGIMNDVTAGPAKTTISPPGNEYIEDMEDMEDLSALYGISAPDNAATNDAGIEGSELYPDLVEDTTVMETAAYDEVAEIAALVPSVAPPVSQVADEPSAAANPELVEEQRAILESIKRDNAVLARSSDSQMNALPTEARAASAEGNAVQELVDAQLAAALQKQFDDEERERAREENDGNNNAGVTDSITDFFKGMLGSDTTPAPTPDTTRGRQRPSNQSSARGGVVAAQQPMFSCFVDSLTGVAKTIGLGDVVGSQDVSGSAGPSSARQGLLNEEEGGGGYYENMTERLTDNDHLNR
eukprot:CAMPEP_0113312774 /NCGR_PEP_ID=MMETSP0010_2-20120614/9473_1 /TAXON_ID=216773 ORGANISM="Corethron hystrix, Strain 308" /NCGR_SAMPLE_ID=MMETSP0010_2 /ASSEMBLY_ACC=CAM_ASM_000155 /LENGTH=417 /DNA_ID=CAMNT_0000168673 /DNA_START=119 /DNA_END=1372 /DNA_ORIENTATION=- /assembly_acc=CAM_ASM_000155